jgi:hypothetical protein
MNARVVYFEDGPIDPSTFQRPDLSDSDWQRHAVDVQWHRYESPHYSYDHAAQACELATTIMQTPDTLLDDRDRRFIASWLAHHSI